MNNADASISTVLTTESDVGDQSVEVEILKAVVSNNKATLITTTPNENDNDTVEIIYTRMQI